MCVTSTFEPNPSRHRNTCGIPPPAHTYWVIITSNGSDGAIAFVGARSEHSASPHARPALRTSWAKHTPPPSHTHRHPHTHTGDSCASKDASAWAALGCAVADPAGTCVGSRCADAGLVPLGAVTAAAGASSCSILCLTDGSDFVVTAEGILNITAYCLRATTDVC